LFYFVLGILFGFFNFHFSNSANLAGVKTLLATANVLLISPCVILFIVAFSAAVNSKGLFLL
jgi:hypothetical protein